MIITSRQNPIIKQFRNPERDSFVVEGEKLVNEAIEAGFEPVNILLTEKNTDKFSGIIINNELSEYISDTKAPQGVHALFKRKSLSGLTPLLSQAIILDRVQDPGNVGAIIRSCEAFGIGVILSENSADVFSSKVIRASAGSVFRTAVQKGNLAKIIPRLRESGFIVYTADLDESAVPLQEAALPPKTAVVIGSEGQGVSEAVSALCSEKLYIPIKGAESLNAAVAAGIICYEINNKTNGGKLCQS